MKSDVYHYNFIHLHSKNYQIQIQNYKQDSFLGKKL